MIYTTVRYCKCGDQLASDEPTACENCLCVRFIGASRRQIEGRLAAAEHDRDVYLDNLTATQARCTSLMEELRAARRIAEAPALEQQVLADVSFERRRQDAKWGDIATQADAPDGTGSEELRASAEEWKAKCSAAERDGSFTWWQVFFEEVLEAGAETDPDKLSAELIQAAAFAVKWVEKIRRRTASTTTNKGSNS